MKSRTPATLFYALLLFSCTIFTGCNGNGDIPDDSSLLSSVGTSPAKSDTTSVTDGTISQSAETPSEPEFNEIPKGEPTIFTAPDGTQIYSSEITDIEGTTKSIEELTKTDYGTSVLCEGFQYFTQPSGISYDNYQNADMFDGIVYKGEISENRNKCKRVNVGDEICGLKLVNGVSEFKIDDYADTPEPYFYDGYLFGDSSERYVAEFEGSIKLFGFIGVTAPNDYEPDGGSLHFTPTESKLPILGDKPEFFERTNFVGSEYSVYSDMTDIDCGFIQELQCDTAGLGVGDMAYVCLTLSDIKYKSSQSIISEIENIEILSDILYHE